LSDSGFWRRFRRRIAAPATPARAAAVPATTPAPAGAQAFDSVYSIFPDIENLRQRPSYPDLADDESFWSVVERARPYTMLSVEALYELYQAVRYVAASGVEGDLVECGVFMGGSVFAAAEWAHGLGLSGRRIFLYDTFAGFPPGTAAETDAFGNVVPFYSHPNFLAVARELIARSSWPADGFVFVEGDVARTLALTRPERIALLRLDTDVYASTRVELEQLYPLLTPGGVLMIDDYGSFQGARRATDEFLARVRPAPLLHRVSQGVRSGLKPASPGRLP